MKSILEFDKLIRKPKIKKKKGWILIEGDSSITSSIYKKKKQVKALQKLNPNINYKIGKVEY